jgi:hypothetical protein
MICRFSLLFQAAQEGRFKINRRLNKFSLVKLVLRLGLSFAKSVLNS